MTKELIIPTSMELQEIEETARTEAEGLEFTHVCDKYALMTRVHKFQQARSTLMEATLKEVDSVLALMESGKYEDGKDMSDGVMKSMAERLRLENIGPVLSQIHGGTA